MSGPVASVDLPLSSGAAESEGVPALPDEIQSAGETDSESLSAPETVAETPAGTADPVADAVAQSIGQYVGFDPTIHAVNPDGTPRMRAGGKGYALKRGKGGRKSVPVYGVADGAGETDLFGEPVSAAPAGETTSASPQTGPANTTINSREAAAMIVMTCTTVLSKVVGPEWAAEKDEARNLTNATKIYLDSKGGLNVSPEMALFLAVTGYAVPRLAHENTQSKFSKVVQWCKDRFAVLRARVGK